MAAADARSVVAQFYEYFNVGDVDSALALCSDALEVSDPGLGIVHGHPPFREYLHTFKRAMPDAAAVVEQTLSSDGVVVAEGRFVGTFTGPLSSPEGDLEPNDSAVDLRFVDISTVVDGLITKYHTYYDQLSLLTQLGLTES